MARNPHLGSWIHGSLRGAIGGFALLLCVGCAGTAGSSRSDLVSSSFGLVGVELDRGRLGNRGDLPTFDPPPLGDPAARAVMTGGITIDKDGLATCRVDAREPTNPANPRSRAFVYPMVVFLGSLNDDETRFISDQRGVVPRLGQATVLHVLSIEEDGRFLTLQAATDEVMLPYVYRFRRNTPPTNVVLAPTL